jgi:pimeloyl-ACP methyl ester carboxylesterase
MWTSTAKAVRLGSSEPHWGLAERAELSGGTVAWERFGEGPPLVLTHGTPSWSYEWRGVVALLAGSFSLYVWDLLGYGDSEQRAGQDVSIAAQAYCLYELLDLWGLESPAAAGHDIGAAIVLRAHLCEGRQFRSLALVDGVVFNPWNTPATMHIRRHLEAYSTMPAHIYEQVVRAHLRTALERPPGPGVIDGYLRPWLGREGQRAYFRKLEQIDEAQTAVLAPRLAELEMPVTVIWGECDRWLDPALGRRLAAAVPEAELHLLPDAGHFSMEDDPEGVARLLAVGAGLLSPQA